MTISENSKKDIIKHLNYDLQRVKVVYPGLSPNFKLLAKTKIEPVLKKYRLNPDFLLFVGTLEPRKNLIRLLKAIDLLEEVTLVIVGQEGWRAKEIKKQAARCRHHLRFLGYVPDQDLPALYNAAKLFVYPSLYEGFGLPVIEAMACGCPVVTAKTSSFPEICGQAAILVDPDNINSLARGIKEILSRPALSKTLKEKGLKKAKEFSWQKCAQETLRVYEEITQ